MQPPAHIDMDVIRQALARRMGGGGGVPQAGGAPVPAIAQQSQPGQPLPTGGPNVPQAPVPMPPNANPTQLPSQGHQLPASSATPAQSAAKLAGQAQGFPDPETRDMAKSLLGKLVQFL